MAHFFAVEIATKHNNVDSIKYCAKLSGKTDGDASSDCFIPPDVPGLPWWLWPDIPGPTATPVTPSPSKPDDPGLPWWLWPLISGPPTTPVTPSPSKPGVPGLPWWLWPFIPGPPTTPVTPNLSKSPTTRGSPTSNPMR
jgi:hypothetical protein